MTQQEAALTSAVSVHPHQTIAVGRMVSPEDNAEEGFGFRYREQSEIDQRRKISDVFDNHARVRGSQLIEVPLVAPVSNFLGHPPRPLPERHSNRLFTTVTCDGLAMTVRYEGTTLTAKWVATLIRNGISPQDVKYHYIQEMVRVETSTELDHRHLRSFHQAGIESFTDDREAHRKNMADLICFAIEVLVELELTPTIRLSHVTIVPSILQRLRLDDFAKKRMIAALEKEEPAVISELLRQCGAAGPDAQLLVQLATLRGSSIESGVEFLTIHRDLYPDAHTDFTDLHRRLSAAGVQAHTWFDPGIYRSLDFYSGITLQGDVDAMGECLGGGDFSGLTESFGVHGPVYSFGLAAGLERLMHVDSTSA